MLRTASPTGRPPLAATSFERHKAEERGFFRNARGHALFFAAHGDPRAGHAWLMCNPLLEEKVFSHGVYVNLARRLAAQGHFVVRFDYEGDGDSEGDIGAIGVSELVSDIHSAARFIHDRFQVPTMGLVSLRAGALIAAAAAPALAVRCLVLWEPAMDGAKCFQECLRSNLTMQLASFGKVLETRNQLSSRLRAGELVSIGGHAVGAAFAESLSAMRLHECLATCDFPVHLVQLGRREEGTLPKSWAAVAALRHVQIHHCASEPFWGEVRQYDPAPRELFELTARLCGMVAPAGQERAHG